MRAPAGADLIEAWEAGLGAPARRGLLTLLADAGEIPVESLLELPLGRWQALLLEMRTATFGETLECEARCGACGERLEFNVDAARLAGSATATPGVGSEIRVGDTTLHYRLATMADLQACSDRPTPEDAARALVSCCIEGARPADRAWPDEVLEAVAEAMVAHDSIADPSVELDCPACRHAWTEALDIGAFLAREIEDCARRLLDEVHDLASAYGWSEHEILTLPHARRRHYLGRVRS
jgi:hypothetical protein